MTVIEYVETVVIGAGVVGLAIARELAMAGREVIIVEAEKSIGSMTSSRNSGVLHAGIYYRNKSHKALMCLKGHNLLRQYLQEKNISHNICGKIIVAINNAQKEKLKLILENAKHNNVKELSYLNKIEVAQIEPEVFCEAALYSPSTGILDVHDLMFSLLKDATDCGATIALNTKISSVKVRADKFILEIESDDETKVSCHYLINSAGLSAQDVAKAIEGVKRDVIPQQVLAKGNYFSLRGKKPFNRLIYPIPEPGGLGIHATLDISGKIRFGPDVEWISTIDYSVDPKRRVNFYKSIKNYWPGLNIDDLSPDYCGIRPKVKLGESMSDDFVIHDECDHGVKNLICLYGIESPGLTSSMALAQYISHKIIN